MLDDTKKLIFLDMKMPCFFFFKKSLSERHYEAFMGELIDVLNLL